MVRLDKGVSIAELAVVISIIALLAAIVSAGVSVKKAADIRGFISEVQSFQSAIEGFDHKYRDLPGDMTDAHDYWDDGGDGVCGTGSECNGDGDSEIDFVASANDNESYRAWQHLNLSGFIEGGYTGVATASDDQADLAINVPSSKRDKVGYMIYYANAGGGSGDRNSIVLASFKPNEKLSNSAVTSKEAYAIDNKLDDGKPLNGLVYAKQGDDASEDCRDGAVYRTSSDSTICMLYFPVRP